MKFRIDRSKWRSGNEGNYAIGLGNTFLLNEKGFMCCLGQVEKQLGLSDENIENKSWPCSTKRKNILSNYNPDCVEGYMPLGMSFDGYENTELSNIAMKINDDQELSVKKREKKLIALFKEYGHELEFYGEPVNFNQYEI